MGRVTFENYGARARLDLSHTEMAARHPIQAEGERRIVPDLIAKLQPRPNDVMLEIGCGTGNLLIPLSFLVARSVGVDHQGVLEAFSKRYSGDHLDLVPGNFLDISLDRKFSIVLVYSVLHCLANKKEVFQFIDKASDLLESGGRLLLGDIPNSDLKKQFLSTEAGRAFDRAWKAQLASQNESHEPQKLDLTEDAELVKFDEGMIVGICKHLSARGLTVTRHAQPPDLPFGNTREDILVCRS